jgi:hypothetical protein
MRNLAGDHYNVDKYIPVELAHARIKPVFQSEPVQDEVPAHFTGKLCGWTFVRAWYYWVAHGPALPFKYAEPMHELIGKEVRVGGHCGCPAPREYRTHPDNEGVTSYHVDTQEGLEILAAVLRKWQEDIQKEKESVELAEKIKRKREEEQYEKEALEHAESVAPKEEADQTETPVSVLRSIGGGGKIL